MKLEFSQLAVYLPYNLKVLVNNRTTPINTLKGYYFSNEKLCFNSLELYGGFSVEEMKPILRPIDELSDFVEKLYGTLENQDITDFMDDDFLNEHQIYSLVDLEGTNPKYMPYGTLQVLLKHHFDVFDLIAQDLAVSIHDIHQAE